MKSIGTQIAIDMYNCSDALLNDDIGVKTFISNPSNDFSMQLRQIYIDREDGNNEYSVYLHCKQGHLTLHIYPELGFMTVDIFTCYKEAHPDKLAKHLRNYFNPDKSKITYLDRGDFGSESDMKPRSKSKIKTIRRARNLGNKLGKIILKPRSM